MEENLIPELTNLANVCINFSEDDLVGGAYSVYGTGWTVGGMVAQTSGTPLLLPINGNSYGAYSEFLPGVVSLGELLQNQGYKQEIMVGSDMSFAGRDLYFEQHGNYKIFDYYTAIEEGKIDEKYFEWWGYEDKKLYEFAKEEILKLAEAEEPFNFTLLTADTHHISGYKCDMCPKWSEVQYENVISCASYQVNEFVKWLSEQEFYEDTTIVICGDHPSMDNDYISAYYDNFKPRRVYNCIINSVVSTSNNKNRKFTTLDMYPTTLAALGVRIEGERVGLGTNLFSSEKTLAEQYGYDFLDEEFAKQSRFYNKSILCE